MTLLKQKTSTFFSQPKNNVAWHWIPPTQQLPKQMRGWWEAIHLAIRHNKKDCNANPYQPILTRWSSNPKPQQDSTQGGWHRTRPNWPWPLLLDYISWKKQPDN